MHGFWLDFLMDFGRFLNGFWIDFAWILDVGWIWDGFRLILDGLGQILDGF